jgi:hypothetical protein
MNAIGNNYDRIVFEGKNENNERTFVLIAIGVNEIQIQYSDDDD